MAEDKKYTNQEFKINDPKLGMNSDVHPSELKPNEYSLLVNGNIQSANGNFIKVTNEHSNILCSTFKEGYKVIGVLPIPAQNRTIYFLVNPTNNKSEIGFINNISYEDSSDLQENCDECNTYLVESKPLEDVEQFENCVYSTIINADCLNFSIDYPVRVTYSIGYSPSNDQPDDVTTIFFTDGLNPRRYLELEKVPYTVIGYRTDCDIPIYSTDLDCSKIQMIRDITPPCIDIQDVFSGGSLKAGTYQFAMCYATSNGNPISSYFEVTNPASVSDQRFVITINTDYPTDKAIKLSISNLNLKFNYINLAVLKTINAVTSVFLAGTFFINSSTFTYVYTGDNYENELRLSIDDILRRPPIYPLATGVTKANQHLFWNGLTEQKEINLQPVVNSLQLKWQTVETNEGFYGNGVSTSKYVGYLRDEVYPFSIYFKLKNGFETADFLLSNNDSDYYLQYPESDVLPCSPSGTPLDVLYDLDNIRDLNIITEPGCSPQTYSKLWQVYNTGINLGTTCDYQAGSNVSGIIYEYFTCYTPTWTNCPSGNPCYNPSAELFCEDFCTPPSGYTLMPPPNPITITVQAFNPSGTVNTYLDFIGAAGAYNSITPSLPPSTSFAIKNCSGTTTTCLSANISLPTNTFCANAEVVSTSSTASCLLVPPLNQPSTYAPLYQIASPTDAVLYNCTGAASGYYDNQVWYQFIATSTVHALKIGYNGENTDLNVEVWDRCNIGTPGPSNLPIACYDGITKATGYYLLMGDVANGQTPLTIGSTYYIRLYTPDPTAIYSTSPVDGVTYCCFGYATLCILTPTPNGTVGIPIPGIFRKECIYQSPPIPQTYNIDSGCEFQVHEYGEFSYWKSSEVYPNNSDVWGDLCGKHIRYHKFPDCCVTHIHNNVYQTIGGAASNSGFATANKIYILGVRLDVKDVKSILDQAVLQGLITATEKYNIIGYGIKRGNRRNTKSIVAKGLLYDVWDTPALDAKGNRIFPDKLIYYPNYPYNELNQDVYLTSSNIGGSGITFPYAGNKNGRYTFHSPNTSFDYPFLGNELKLETVEFGKTKGEYAEVIGHAPYILLTKEAYILAEALAAIEVVLDAAIDAMPANSPVNVLGSGSPILGWVIFFAIDLAMGFVTKQSKYTKQWTDLFKNMGTPKNPAIVYSSVGNYNGYSCVKNYCSSTSNYIKRNIISTSRYLESGNFQFLDQTTNIRFNNFQRESSVFLSIDAFTLQGALIPAKAFSPITDIDATIPADDSRTQSLLKYVTTCSLGTATETNIASYYASIKNFVPDQYGTPNQIEWIDTGYCGIIDWGNPVQESTCDTIFGGDTFLTRFAIKRKLPFFIQDRVGYGPNTDVQYSVLSNIGFPFYFFNSIPVDPTSASSFFSFTPPQTSFLCSSNTFFYQVGYMPLQMYGIPYFICESDYNVDLRHGEDLLAKNFYPNVGDVTDWTQQIRVPISQDNTFYYNRDYSKQNKENPYYILRNDFKQDLIEFKSKYPNRAIYSVQGVPNWLSYSANDYYDFPLEDGKLIALNGIEQDKVVARQEKSTKVFNAYITMESSLANVQVSVGNMFATKPQEYYKSDLGFGGSSHYAFESTPYGHFFINTQNPGVFQLGGGLKDITKGNDGQSKVRSWFRENLPFNISKDFPEVNVDNSFKWFGITTTWDNKFDRLFITKRDAKLKTEFKGFVSYANGRFIHNPSGNFNSDTVSGTVINVFDTRYFCDKSWTIAYSPILGEWISFYSFTPNYYSSNELYFSSGINYSLTNDNKEIGVWNHLLTNKSYQVFYGKLYPFIFEYATDDKVINDNLIYIQYQADVIRYQNNLNHYTVNNKTFTNATIYNQNQSTGLLNLIVAQPDNLQQSVMYPQISGYSTDILVTNIENNWRFNMFQNVNSQNGQPIMRYVCGFPYKTQNNNALNYNTPFIKQHMVGDYFSVRLENRLYSNYKFIVKPLITSEIISIS